VHLTPQPTLLTQGTWLSPIYLSDDMSKVTCSAPPLLFRSSIAAAHKILRNIIATNMIKTFPAERNKCSSRKGIGRSCITLWKKMYVGGSIAQTQPTNSSLYKYKYFLLPVRVGAPKILVLVKSNAEKGNRPSPPIMHPAMTWTQ